jgi:glycine betaine/proline transport system substrate-binding protein
MMKYRLTRRDMLKLSGGTLASVSLLGLAGCGGSGGSGSSDNSDKTLTLGNIGWAENIAVSNLTKVLFEEDLGYGEVELKLLDVGPLFQGVAGGDLQAFQDVWMPNHEDLLNEVGDDVQHLDPWFQGQTAFGLAVPNYMGDIRSIADLNQAGTDTILGIEPGAPFVAQVEDEVIPAYNLNLDLKASSTAGMLSEAERLYGNEEPFVFMPWVPHPMNEVFEYHFLEDPKNAQGVFDQPAKISTVVNADLKEDDPNAFAFMNAYTLNESQLNTLMDEISNADDDAVAGSKAWLKNNRDVVKPWIDAAKQA